MSSTTVLASLVGVVLVLAGSVALGTVRPRRYRTAADFYVAARSVGTLRNGAAISSEYTSAATYLGLAGLIAVHGAPMLWYPVGAAAGYVVVLALIVAPLRRSGTYTLSDFAQWRLGSAAIRRSVTAIVVLIGLIYLVAQLHAAGLVLGLLAGLPQWAGWLAVTVAVLAVALTGGMGSVTGVQAAQFWLKLAVLGGCGLVLWLAWRWGTAVPRAVHPPPGFAAPYSEPGMAGIGDPSLFGVLTVLVACALGTMGLPHVIVRVYTNPDGRSARRSVLAALALLAAFYALPPCYGLLGRLYAPGVAPDAVVLVLPARMLPGPVGDALTGLLAAGAFAAFLATSSGIVVAVGGAVSTCVLGGGVRGFRLSALGLSLVALALAWLLPAGGSIVLVLLGFGLSAATLCPLLVLGVWWRRLSTWGAAAGLCTGGVLTVALVCAHAFAPAPLAARFGLAVHYPAPFVVPLAFLVMVLVSLATPRHVPRGTAGKLARMHVPERPPGRGSDRSSVVDDRSPS